MDVTEPTSSSAPGGRRTFDAPTRAFHWLLAACFAGAYATSDADGWRWLHVTFGYTMAGLLTWRVLWGLVGPRHTRLSVLLRKLQGLPAWARAARQGQWPALRSTHNLMVPLGVMFLMLMVLVTTASGYLAYQDWFGELFEELVEEAHELLGNALLVLVLGHIALMLWISLARRQNHVWPMVTGHSKTPGGDVFKRNHAWLAALMCAAALAFGLYQWQTSPAPDGEQRSGATGSADAEHEAGEHGHRGRDDDAH